MEYVHVQGTAHERACKGNAGASKRMEQSTDDYEFGLDDNESVSRLDSEWVCGLVDMCR